MKGPVLKKEQTKQALIVFNCSPFLTINTY